MNASEELEHDNGAAVMALMVDPSAAIHAAARLHASLRAGRVRNGWRDDGSVPRYGRQTPGPTAADASVDVEEA